MGRAARADRIVAITSNRAEADEVVMLSPEQVLSALAEQVGQVATVQADGTWGVAALPQASAITNLAADDAPVLYSEAEEQGWRDAVLAKMNEILDALREAGVIAS